MGYNSFLRSPKEEEQQVPDATVTELDDTKESYAHGEIDIMDELEGILGIENEEKLQGNNKIHGHLSWDFMDWESEFHNAEEEDGGDERDQKDHTGKFIEEESEYNQIAVKKENLGFWVDVEKRFSLNLNYQDVLDAWSKRGPL